MNKYYIDCEFDGHSGPLLSMAVVSENGESLYIRTTEEARDPWVRGNVVPKLDILLPREDVSFAHVPAQAVGGEIVRFVGTHSHFVVVADSPVDIARFCTAITTSSTGGYMPCIADGITFEVYDVDCYPTPLSGAVQHNAWWDAMALKAKLEAAES